MSLISLFVFMLPLSFRNFNLDLYLHTVLLVASYFFLCLCNAYIRRTYLGLFDCDVCVCICNECQNWQTNYKVTSIKYIWTHWEFGRHPKQIQESSPAIVDQLLCTIHQGAKAHFFINTIKHTARLLLLQCVLCVLHLLYLYHLAIGAF